MTKEDLETKVHNIAREFTNSGNCDRLTDLLDEFFSQNVCIPKGRNIETNILDMKTWVEIPINQWRIKPSEPEFEYQWILNGTVSDMKFYTKHEALQWSCKSVIKIEETKRIR